MAQMAFDEGIEVLEKRTALVVPVIYGVIGTAILAFLGEVMEIGGIADLGTDVPDGISTIVALIYVAFAIAYLVSVVLVCMWLYRAQANLHAAGHEDLEFSPGWAVGWYFVPVANLFKPFQAMRELWNTSHLAQNDFGGEAPPTVKYWWFGFVGGNILSNIGFRFQNANYPGDSGYTVGTAIGAVGTILTIASAYFLLQLVREILQAQKSGMAAAEIFG